MDSEAVTFSISTVTSAISTALKPFVDNFTVGNIATVLALVLTACLALYLFYWGARKGLGMLKGSFSGGGLRF